MFYIINYRKVLTSIKKYGIIRYKNKGDEK